MPSSEVESRKAPWFEILNGPNNDSVLVQEEDIDGETHPKHVHRVARANYQGLAFANLCPIKKPSCSVSNTQRQVDLAGELAVSTAVSEDIGHSLAPTSPSEERSKERSK